MVNVGVIGPGPVWETRYRPAIERLGPRIGVCAVYDPVAARAEQVAAEIKATAAPGILALANHPSVQAILLLDPGWGGCHVVDLLCLSNRPVYVAGSFGCGLEDLTRIQEQAAANHILLMPEFTLRHTPSTARLQELIATKLGRPREIVIEAAAPAEGEETRDPAGTLTSGTDFLVGLLDWCRYLVRTSPLRVTAQEPDKRGGERRATIVFSQPRKGGVSPQVEIVLRPWGGTSTAAAPAGAQEAPRAPVDRVGTPVPAPLLSEVICEQGRASILSQSEISWSNGSSSTVTETLTSDRSAVEVMLDHFCRRVVGGLIPVADVGDVCRGVGLARAVERSLRTGESIDL